MTIPQTAVAAASAAFPGMLADSGPNNDIRSYVAESVLSLPVGSVVGQGTLATQVINLAAITDKMVGVVVHSAAYSTNEINAFGDDWTGTYGIERYMTCNVLRKGRVWMLAEEAVTPASAPLVRCIPAAAELPGVMRDSADAADLYDVSAFCRFLTSTTGAGLVLCEWDFTMFGADPLD
jgi:hypothetical protein